MAIEPKDLLIYKSQVNLDTDDGGGAYSGQILIDGQSNNLFPDVSELDRTMGRVSMRKIFPAVDTNDTDSLMGATVLISENPQDPNVSALLFSTGSYTDRRNAAKSRVESYLNKGAQAVGSLLDTAYIGMKSIQVIMDENEEPNRAGDTLVLVTDEGQQNEYQQYIRLTEVSSRIATIRAGGGVNQANIKYKLATYSFADPLERDFTGVSATEWYSNAKPVTIIRETIVADSGKYYGSVGLADDVAVNSFTVNAKSMFAQLIPANQVETPLVDLNAANENVTLVAANAEPITVAIETTVSSNQGLYIGSAIMPGSLSVEVFGQAVTDKGGLLRTASGTQVGTVDYQGGHIVWTSAAGTGNALLEFSFIPAAAPVMPFESYAVPVTQANQSNNWTGILTPIPAPKSLIVSFMAQGRVYVLKDDGTGRLVGANETVGSGTINYTTGSWLLTTGALPDVGTPILLQWGSPISTFSRAGLTVAPAYLDFTTFHNGLVNLTVTWPLNGQQKSATINSAGEFTGDASGYVRLNDGKGRIIPNELPHKDTVFTISYEYGSGKTQQLSSGEPDNNNTLHFTIGTGLAIKPGSVGLDVPIINENYAILGTVSLHDIPNTGNTTGNLVDGSGVVMGSITYATGAVVVTPVLTKWERSAVYAPVNYAIYGAA